MLCSNCSHEVKPIVAVDVDGTLGDYHGHFLNFAADYLDMHKDKQAPWRYDGTLRLSAWFTQVFNCEVETYRQVKLAYRQGGMKRTMPLLVGAHDLCYTIKKAGAELWITTTRPYLSLDNIIPDTVEWCRRHGIEYDGMLFDEDKYEQLAKRVDSQRVVAVVDDLPEMYDAAAKALYYGADVPILAQGDYNKGVRRPIRGNLYQIGQMVNGRINWWRESHA
jgi:hypothetical protein